MFGRRALATAALVALACPAAAVSAPGVVSASASGSTVTVLLAERAARPSFSVSVDGLPRAVTATEVRGRTVSLRLQQPVAADDVVTVAAKDGRVQTAANRSAPGCTFLPRALRTPGEGRVDLRRALPAAGPLRVAMLFVVPRGTTAAESPAALYASLAPQAERWFAAASHGRAQLQITPIARWLPVAGTDVSDALDAAAAASVDLSGFDAVAAVLPSETQLGASHAEVVPYGRVHFGVVLAPHPTAESARAPALWTVLVHELGHVVGLPDLYVSAGQGAESLYAGPWDPMSVPLGQSMLAWHSWQLGWLDPANLGCIFSGSREETLAPATVAGGLKALIAPLGSGSALVVEARRRTGLDAGLCDEGVLVYVVQTDAVPKAAPVRVVAPEGADGACGPLSRAALHAGGSLRTAGVRVEVLAEDGDGYRVRLSR
jgi:M6 family metalloprotease-like protein